MKTHELHEKTIGHHPRMRGHAAGLCGAAAVTAVSMALGAGVAPNANAYTLDATTTGPLFWLNDKLGLVPSITASGVPLIGDVTINFNFSEANPVGLYDAIDAFAFSGVPANSRPNPNFLSDVPTGPLVLAYGRDGVSSSVQAYQAMLASANGQTPEGYTPLSEGLPLQPNTTNLPLALINNPGTPNGGLYTRFQRLSGLFGKFFVSPEAESGQNGTDLLATIKMNTAIINVALGYSMLADFPVTANPFALANSIMASALPTYLLGGGELQGDDTDTIVGNFANLLFSQGSSTSYSTFVPNALPELELMRLPARLVNLLFEQIGVDFRVGTPFANALQPAAEILANIGYTDVLTPDKLDQCATDCDNPDEAKTWAELGYKAYDRTYMQSAAGTGDLDYTPWLSVQPLTRQEKLAVPGAVVQALIEGTKAAFFPNSSTDTPQPAPTAANAVTAVAETASPSGVSPAVVSANAPRAVTDGTRPSDGPMADSASDFAGSTPAHDAQSTRKAFAGRGRSGNASPEARSVARGSSAPKGSARNDRSSRAGTGRTN